MAGIRGQSSPPGNQNAFRHGLASINQRRFNASLTPVEQTIIVSHVVDVDSEDLDDLDASKKQRV